MNVTLNRRKSPNGKARKGLLAFSGWGKTYAFPTLENEDCLIPEGSYPLKMTWSPKFRKLMPEICDVPERTGIRIHLGSKPQHSAGCVLLRQPIELETLKAFINYNDKYHEEQLTITVSQQG